MNLPYLPPPPESINVLYLDDDLLLVEKPAGLLSVPGRGDDKQDSLISRVQLTFPDALIVHRLDMATSGIMVIARNKEAHRQLSRLFSERNIEKTYCAVVEGIIDADSGRIDFPIMADWPNRPKQMVAPLMGKPSITYFKVLSRDLNSGITRVELKPETGRTHQLRVHLEFIGHAILGDRLYASPETQQRSERLLLHANELSFEHPITHQTLRYSSSIPF
ncbi:RluA family pseudouridine synthase [Leucothrix mucor]|uniref:RluA family pseudouridine synthase n=1 Tax=Leucothrix mucor TaxID=45248 RepID=UPI0003B39733|nr:RluA family pseudouridine synthase [Leucothrix mucor]